jgi:hypothetical protein
MKNKILIICFVVMGMATAKAQIGLYAGVNGSANLVFILNQNTYGEQELEYRATPAIMAGPVVGINFLPILGLQTEVNFAAMGQNYEDMPDGRIMREVKLNYTYVPIMLKYTAPSPVVRFYAMGGPQFGFLNSASIDHVVDDRNLSLADARERFNDRDFGLTFGTGAQINLPGGFSVSPGLRFYLGLSDINTEEWRTPNGRGIYEPSRNFYGGFNLALTYRFIEIL